jgi:hypothetical protein
MNSLRTLLVGLLATLFLCSGGCKKEPVGPTLPKNPREYAWTIDTLAYPGSLQTLMYAIWGSSSRNIYVCGHNDQRFAKMYHWDGRSWTNVKLDASEGGPLLGVASLDAISGFDPNHVFAVGVSGQALGAFLIQFNGSQWRRIAVPNGKGLLSVWVRSPSEVWIGGLDGFLARYNGSQFSRDTLRYTFDTTRMGIQIGQITGDATQTHLVLVVSPDTLISPMAYFYERVGSQWQIRDSSYEYYKVFIDPAGSVYRYLYGIQRKTGNTWVTVLSDLRVGRQGMAASSASNVFAVGSAGGPSPAGRVYHYNGSDWFEYSQLRLADVHFAAVWTDGREAFILGTTSGFPMKTLVLHGK